jgi:hypothetical protein
MFIEGWIGDRYHIRGPIVIFNALCSIIGLAVLGWTKSPGAQYFGVFLALGGSQSNVPGVMAWQANNIRGHWKRAFCSAVLIGSGGTGGIIGALVFRAQDAPRYLPGLWAAMT